MNEDRTTGSIAKSFAVIVAGADATIRRLGYGHPKSIIALKIIELVRTIAHDEEGLRRLAEAGKSEIGGAAGGKAFGDLVALTREFEGMPDEPEV